MLPLFTYWEILPKSSNFQLLLKNSNVWQHWASIPAREQLSGADRSCPRDTGLDIDVIYHLMPGRLDSFMLDPCRCWSCDPNLTEFHSEIYSLDIFSSGAVLLT